MAIDAFVLILVLMALGKLCAQRRWLPANSAEVFNQVALGICLPAAILRFAPALVFERELLALVAIPWLLLLASIALVRLLARWLALSDAQRAVLLLCLPLGNTSFLGYPLTEALLGRSALPYAVAYDQFGSFLILSSWGLWVLVRYGGDRPPRLREVGQRLLRFPPFIALLIGLLLMPAEPPAFIASLLQRLADALLPIVALAVGLQLRLRVPAAERLPLILGLASKLILLPLLALALVRLFDMQGTVSQVAVLEAAMPPMITAAALAISHRLAPELAAALVGFGTPLALLSLLLWTHLLGAG